MDPRANETKGPRLVNFCLEPLTKHVECTSISADDYPIGNLTSRLAHQRLRGFQVERFIRPPVHLIFHFLAPVNIACVVVKPDLTEGAEANVAVFASSATLSTYEQQQQKMVLCSRGTARGQGAVLVFKNKVFERRHWKADLSSSFASVLGSHMTYTDCLNRSEESFRDISNVKCLRLSVNYFSGPKPVSLKLVEVWGTLGVPTTSREDMGAAHTAITQLSAETKPVSDVSVYTNCPKPGPAVPLCQPWKATADLNEGAVVGMPNDTPVHCSVLKEGVPPILSNCVVPVGAYTHVRELGNLRKESSQAHFPINAFPLHHSNRVKDPLPSTMSSSSGGGSVLEGGSQCPNSRGKIGLQGTLNQHDSSTLSDGMLSRVQSYHRPPYAGTVPCSGSGATGLPRQPHMAVDSAATDIRDTTDTPGQYLDEITCELMALPMLLPSGHFVDRSTLEKLRHTDSTYGRLPSDPFTGVAFTESIQPQFSVELKQQIDGFVSKHRPNRVSSSSGQTLGSAREIASHLLATQQSEKRRGKRVRDEAVSLSDQDHRPLAKKRPLTALGDRGGGKRVVVPAAAKAQDAAPSSTCTSSSSSSTYTSSSSSGTPLPTTSAAAKAGHDMMCSHAHEVEVAASLDRELEDLLRS